MSRSLEGAEVLILGGTGSLGQRLFRRILCGEMGRPASLTVFSRDEAKQHYMRLDFMRLGTATEEVIFGESVKPVRWMIGDVRSYPDVKRAVDRADVIIHAAAMKQVPTCEYFGAAAVDTNVTGAVNLVRALREGPREPKTVVGISTDKACKPVNLMGMTKAIQERILVQGNLDTPWARLVNVRYGNVMASRGSAIPHFIDLVRRGQPIPITDRRMSRFLMTLNQSVDLVFAAYAHAHPGETYLPVLPSALVVDMALGVAEDAEYPLTVMGIRPGEKIHETLVSEEETPHTVMRDGRLVILPVLPELRVQGGSPELPFRGEYSSGNRLLPLAQVMGLLRENGLTVSTAPAAGEILH